MSPTPRIRNGYLSFGGKYGKTLKRRRKRRWRFLGPLILGEIEKW